MGVFQAQSKRAKFSIGLHCGVGGSVISEGWHNGFGFMSGQQAAFWFFQKRYMEGKGGYRCLSENQLRGRVSTGW